MALPEMRQDGWWYQSKFIPYFESSEDWARSTFAEVMGWSKTLSQKARATKEHLR